MSSPRAHMKRQALEPYDLRLDGALLAVTFVASAASIDHLVTPPSSQSTLELDLIRLLVHTACFAHTLGILRLRASPLSNLICRLALLDEIYDKKH